MQSRRAAIIEHYRELGQELTAVMIDKYHGRPSLETITLTRELAAAAPNPFDAFIRERFQGLTESQTFDEVKAWKKSRRDLRYVTDEQHIELGVECGYRLATDFALYFAGQREEYGTLGVIDRIGWPGLTPQQFWQGHAPNRDLLQNRQKPFEFDPYQNAPPGARSMEALGRIGRGFSKIFRLAR